MFHYVNRCQRNYIDRCNMMADINKVANEARKIGFIVFVEIGAITIDDKKFLYKDLNKAKKYIRTSEPKSLDKWR